MAQAAKLKYKSGANQMTELSPQTEADLVTVSPAISGISGSNVQTVLQNMAAKINSGGTANALIYEHAFTTIDDDGMSFNVDFPSNFVEAIVGMYNNASKYPTKITIQLGSSTISYSLSADTAAQVPAWAALLRVTNLQYHYAVEFLASDSRGFDGYSYTPKFTVLSAPINTDLTISFTSSTAGSSLAINIDATIISRG